MYFAIYLVKGTYHFVRMLVTPDSLDYNLQCEANEQWYEIGCIFIVPHRSRD